MSDPQQDQNQASDELQRLRDLQVFQLEGLEGDPSLKAITDFAAHLCDTPVALVSFVEAERKWFPAKTGLDARETARETSFCAHTMKTEGIMVVSDATLDERFADNALVVGEPHIRFYAGAPLVSGDGVQIGALCVIDREPRADLNFLQREGLKVLASNIVAQLVQRRSHISQVDALGQQESQFRILADTMPQMVWSTRPDGFHDYYNARWYEFTGMPVGSTDGVGWNEMFHPDDQDRAWSLWRHSLETGDPYEIEYRLRNADGAYRWTLGRALPMRDRNGSITRWFGTCTDIHDQKLIQAEREMIAQELSHRIKNIFSVVNGLISFSTREYPELKSAADDLRSRIIALGNAHDFVRPHSEASRPEKQPNSLSGLLFGLLGAYAERVQFVGEEVIIDDHSATPLALTFHELATNAAKYGALSEPGGSVTISCATNNESAQIVWTERGGPVSTEPTSYGFGTKLIEISILRQMAGSVSRTWSTEGLEVQLTMPLSSMLREKVRHS